MPTPCTPNGPSGGGTRKAMGKPGLVHGQSFGGTDRKFRSQDGKNRSRETGIKHDGDQPIPPNVHDTSPTGTYRRRRA
jgi:hypothetical protein